MHRLLQMLLIVVALAGCASGEKMLTRDALPKSNVGYAGGNFTLKKPPFAAAFVLSDESGKEYTLPFTTQRSFDADHNETNLVELPPGKYRATHWIVFNSYWGSGPASREFKAELKPSPLTEPFAIRGGEVVFLGKFVSENTWTNGYFTMTTQGRWNSEQLSGAQMKRILEQSYPAFASQPLTCLACRP